MIEKLFKYIRGYLYVSVQGKKPERFVNLCNNKGIVIYDVSVDNNILYFYISVSDFKKIKEIVRKSRVHIRIKERYGLPFFLFKNRKRKMLLLGVISGAIIVYAMSLYIWQISFEGNYSYTGDELRDYLLELGVEWGMKKSEVDPELIEKSIRNRYNDIKWVSVEMIGTNLIIHIKENFNEIQALATEEDYSIVADKDAEIISIVTRRGTPLVKAGDTVKAGDVMIGGYYDIMSDFGELIRTEYVQADGKILAKTVYNINENLDRKYKKKNYTGNESEYYEFRMFDKTVKTDWFSKDYEVFDKITRENQVVFGESFYLPLFINKNKCREYNITEVLYTSEEAYAKGKEKLDLFLQNLIEKGIQIIENNVKIEVGENNITISGEIICYEYIGVKGALQHE